MTFFFNNYRRQHGDVRVYGGDVRRRVRIHGRAYGARRTATGAAYAGGRMTSRADVRRRVGIPIPNVKLPYYPLYVLGGLCRSTTDAAMGVICFMCCDTVAESLVK